ncbi:MAG: hypothetical protein JWR61_5850, partial [Ferruginibacter sp.]|nr:hypothetical protein [Ferruginibacter sp.]
FHIDFLWTVVPEPVDLSVEVRVDRKE